MALHHEAPCCRSLANPALSPPVSRCRRDAAARTAPNNRHPPRPISPRAYTAARAKQVKLGNGVEVVPEEEEERNSRRWGGGTFEVWKGGGRIERRARSLGRPFDAAPHCVLQHARSSTAQRARARARPDYSSPRVRARGARGSKTRKQKQRTHFRSAEKSTAGRAGRSNQASGARQRPPQSGEIAISGGIWTR